MTPCKNQTNYHILQKKNSKNEVLVNFFLNYKSLNISLLYHILLDSKT